MFKTEVVPSQFYGWSTGTILNVTESNVKVSFDGEAEEEDVGLLIGSKDISPYGSYTGGNEWRDKIAKGDIIDCLDTAANWYQATVLNVESKELAAGRSAKRLYVGYRTYSEDGTKKDKEEKSFHGWSETYDEWINANSLRVQRKGTVARLGRVTCKKSIDEEDKVKIEDASDLLINSINNQETYAIVRSGDKGKSEAVVSFFNVFGMEGGFDRILARITNREKLTTYSKFLILTF